MTVWDDTLPDLAAGDFVTDTAVIGKIMGALHGLTDEWPEFEPEWTSTGTAPDIGAGSVAGNWTRSGNQGHLYIRKTWGADTTGGTGSWAFSVPAEFFNFAVPLVAIARDTSAGAYYPGVAFYDSVANTVSRVAFHTSSGTLGNASATHPFTWATTDILAIHAGPQLS